MDPTMIYVTTQVSPTSDFICDLINTADTLKLPLTFLALIFIALLRIGGAFFPQQAQQVGEYFRGIVYGVVIFAGASWFIEILWGEQWAGCQTWLPLLRPVVAAAQAGYGWLETAVVILPRTLAAWGGTVTGGTLAQVGSQLCWLAAHCDQQHAALVALLRVLGG